MWKLLLMLNMTANQESPFYKGDVSIQYFILQLNVISYMFLDCGIIKTAKQTRVVNGTESSEVHWPWMAFINLTLIHKRDNSCGGSLIGTRHILTAAHCVVDEEFKP